MSLVIDTSAFVAIFKGEPLAAAMKERIGRAPAVLVPGPCLAELALLRRVAGDVHEWARKLIEEPRFELSGVSVEEARLAADAARLFGKGSGHPARLNFGGCLVYAIAKYRDLPLLFAGDDFTRTDIVPALEQRV